MCSFSATVAELSNQNAFNNDLFSFSLLPENLLAAEVLCQNVTFAEHYKFIWKDKNIEQVNVTVFHGSLCDGGTMTFLL